MTKKKGQASTPGRGAPPRVPPDQAARDRIRGDLDTTFLVEAGAGSGKTQSLVERMVALIASGRTTIQTLAAVTFTRKAAAELRGRFQVALESGLQAGDGSWTGEERGRLRDALRNLEQGFVGTIHSFCARLLRERPIEAGIDPEFEEMEDLEDSLFREECWAEYLLEVRLNDEDILRDLDGVGLLPDDLKDAFESLSVYPEVALAPGRDEPPDYEALRSSLNAFLDRARDTLVMVRLEDDDALPALAGTGVSREALAEACQKVAALPAGNLLALADKILDSRREKGYDGLQMLIRRVLLRRRNLGFSDYRALMETVELFDRSPGVTKNRWRSKEEADGMAAAFEEFREKTVVPALRAWREFRHSKVLAFLGPAAEFYAASRRARSRLNFADQLMLTSRLLRDNPEVRRYFQARYRRVLVDEFQDTDPIQAEILFYLTGRDPEERDWTAVVPAPGSLFLVGDPKQSIYRFRRADIDIYNLVKNRIKEGGGQVLELTANFRSLPCIADRVNPVFKGVFPAGPNDYQARFAPLEVVREGCPGAAAGVFKATVPAVKYHREKEIAGLDARRLAEFVAWASSGGLRIATGRDGDRPAGPGDVLVLFRYKKNMEVYARELEDRGVPFEISGSDAFVSSDEIGEIANLLQALRDPANPVAAIAVLRGIFFGVSDQELLDQRTRNGKLTVAGEAAPGGEGDGKVRRALRTLHEWRQWTMKFPPSAVLEMVLERSGLLNDLVSSEMGSSRAGNVLKLVEVVRNLETEGLTSFAAVADFIRDWVGAQAVEEMSLTPGRRNAVRLMNLHKAKGLEAPVVILANPAGVPDHEPEKHIVRTGPPGEESPSPDKSGPSAPLGYFLFEKRSAWHGTPVSHPAGWDEKAAEEKKYEAAEDDRLMYVAATRARDLLVISAYEGDLGGKRAWGGLEDGMGDLPELERPSPGAVRPARGKLVLKPEEVRKGRLEIMAKRGTASVASYLLESVTSLAKRDRESPEWAAGGLGMRWGTAVHALLSALGKAGDSGGQNGGKAEFPEATLALLALNALESAGIPPADEDKLVSLVREILASDFWARAMASERRFFEVPFTVKTGPGDPEYADLVSRPGLLASAGGKPVAPAKGAPLFLSGAIDLAFLESDGWVIADYKTDKLDDSVPGGGSGGSKEAFAGLVDYYRPQVELYGRFWEKITGQRVKESGLYFTSYRTWVRIG